jgi:hypothetical protein
VLPAALFERVNAALAEDQERLKWAEYKVRVLEERLRLERIEKYGAGSEKLSDAPTLGRRTGSKRRGERAMLACAQTEMESSRNTV